MKYIPGLLDLLDVGEGMYLCAHTDSEQDRYGDAPVAY
jgi:hypothetical protein